MTRDDVEKLLDLQVMAGKLAPELKEEKLREFDMKVEQMRQQQYGQQNYQNGGTYPRIGKSQGILSGPEMLLIVVLAVILCVAAVKNVGWLVAVMTGVIFVYISTRATVYFAQRGQGLSFKFILADILGIGMLVYGLFIRFGSAEAQESFNSYNDILAVASIILVGAGMIIGNTISNVTKRNKYTQMVEATCVELKNYRYGSQTPAKLSPVYQYYLNGDYHRVMNGVYFNKGYPQIGEVREIYISPDHPGEYYEPKMSRSISIFLYILGAFFIAMGILVWVLGM